MEAGVCAIDDEEDGTEDCPPLDISVCLSVCLCCSCRLVLLVDRTVFVSVCCLQSCSDMGVCCGNAGVCDGLRELQPDDITAEAAVAATSSWSRKV